MNYHDRGGVAIFEGRFGLGLGVGVGVGAVVVAAADSVHVVVPDAVAVLGTDSDRVVRDPLADRQVADRAAVGMVVVRMRTVGYRFCLHSRFE